jgi:hypothetical protein
MAILHADEMAKVMQAFSPSSPDAQNTQRQGQTHTRQHEKCENGQEAGTAFDSMS